METYDLALKAYSPEGEVNEKGVRLSMDLAKPSGKFEKEIAASDAMDFTILRRRGLIWDGSDPFVEGYYEREKICLQPQQC
jgi:hypothetical protein